MRQKILFLLLVLFISETTFSVPLRVKKSNYKFYPVTKVIDGDTFWIDDGSSKELKVRLIGVDAPESRNTGRKVKAIYGKESSEYLTRLIGGKKVRLEYDVDHFDQYGRTLAYVYLLNGIFVNANLVKNGYAMVMTVPPNVKYAETFLKLARKARNNKKGLWGKESRDAMHGVSTIIFVLFEQRKEVEMKPCKNIRQPCRRIDAIKMIVNQQIV